ncbi:hypothetical protein A8A01_07925 [Ewingella americana]|nr:hypothetical protein A8A01_07925 [Ewingella americana]
MRRFDPLHSNVTTLEKEHDRAVTRWINTSEESQIHNQGSRQGQSRYLLGIGATLLLSGTLLLLGGVEVYPACLMAAGVVSWLIGWKRAS